MGSLCAGLVTVGGARTGLGAEVALVLVTSTKTPLENLSLGDLRQLFLGATLRDDEGGALVPLNQEPGTRERQAFDRRVLGLSPDEMARYWIDQKVRGLKGAPRNLGPPHMLARVVERFVGAVAYLRPDQSHAGLRALRIEGRPASDPHYALSAPAKEGAPGP